MIKPKALKKGDKVAIVSLSSGLIGEPDFLHKFEIGKERLEKEFGLQVVAMPHALKGINFVYKNPELRAKDLMDAFKDSSIKAIITAIGGEDTLRLLPYIDYEIIRNNPKIFLGYSDTTANHFMMRKAGLNSFYGCAIMTQFAEYTKMFDYSKNAVLNMLFTVQDKYEIKPAGVVCNEFLPWGEENRNKQRKLETDTKGYEVLQGEGTVSGELIGGCLESMIMLTGTSIWPDIDEWKGKIFCIETSEENPSPDLVRWFLRNLAAQGILNVISGIIVGKPEQEKFYEEYKEVYKKVVGYECNRPDMPILYNVNFGHGDPSGILPLGCMVELNVKNKTLFLIENCVF